MKAIVQDRYGPIEVLGLDEIDPPAVGDRDVLIRVHAAGVDPGVWHLMTGLPYLARVMGFGLRRPKDRVRGRDVAGTVEAVGAGVTRFAIGDEVLGTCEGSFAELAVTAEDRLVAKPGRLTFEQAAALPISGITALEAVQDKGRVEAGQRVLVIGAGGGVGSYAVQIAKAAGAEVTALCGPDKAELVRAIGADEVLDRTRTDVGDHPRAFDLVIDTAGNRTIGALRRALTARGTLVVVGGEGGGPILQGFDRGFRGALLSPFVGQRLVALVASERLEALERVVALVETGAVTPVVGRTYALADAADAIAHLHDGHVAGKLVVTT
jgi:NADPH:quinone reductase-like Zn-dependent oxidoreductase